MNAGRGAGTLFVVATLYAARAADWAEAGAVLHRLAKQLGLVVPEGL